jgi:uncharacterized membrane protein
MEHEQYLATSLFSLGIIGMGALSVIYRDFAFGWQPVPAFHPGREAFAVICGLFMICASIALLFRTTSTIAVRAVFPFLLAWLCLKIPALIVAPQVEAVWLGFGEIGMLLAGGLVLFASQCCLEDSTAFSGITGQSGMRIAQIVFGLSTIPVGLGHLFYADITATLVPSWMPFRIELAYLTGLAQIACGIAILFSLLPRAAAMAEALMLALFAFLVWGPDTWIASTPSISHHVGDWCLRVAGCKRLL